MRPLLVFVGALSALAYLLALAAAHIPPRPHLSGWGLNPGSAGFATPEARRLLLAALDDSTIEYFREGVPLDGAPLVRRPGGKILGLIPYYFGLSPQRALNLRSVYNAARRLGAREGRHVDVWENYNEPDLGFNPAPPDQSVAFMKAVYLGLKDSCPSAPPPVLLPALGLPPGPWLDRAERNGLLSYGDGFNFHFYSRAEDFPDEIRLMRDAQAVAVAAGQLPRALPLWVTEIGLDAMPADRLDDPAGRRQQADFFRATTRAAGDMGLSAFMPYAYRDRQQGYDLAAASQKPYPAWTVYTKTTRDLPLDTTPKWIDQSQAAPRVILQWLPDDTTCRPHKVSGTYRFTHRIQPITGRIRIYSFASEFLRGHLDLKLNNPSRIQPKWIPPAGSTPAPLPASVQSESAWLIDLPPGATKDVQVTLTAPPKGYALGEVDADFTEVTNATLHEPASHLYFGCETAPLDDDFRDLPCFLRPPGPDTAIHPVGAPPAITSRSGPWRGLNGIRVAPAPDDVLVNPAWSFQLDQASTDPARPPMAVACVHGLPPAGFLHLSSSRPLGHTVSLRVDLVDAQGQRFSIFENGGLDPGELASQVWLNFADFLRYFFGRLIPGQEFNPRAVREIQVRFYFKFLHDPIQLGFETMQPRQFSR